MLLTRREESTRKGNRRSSSNSRQKEATESKLEEVEVTASTRLPTVQEPSESESSVVIDQKDAKSIEIDGQDGISSVAYFPDGEHIVGGGYEGKIRRWQVKDGKEVGTPMDTGDIVCSIAVSPDGKWIVSGTAEGQVIIWNAVSHEKAPEFPGHELSVKAVEVSPDATTLATTSHDECACLWSLDSIPPQFLRIIGFSDICQPYHRSLAAIKFSPDGRLFAAATWVHDYVRIYDFQDRPPLVTFPIDVSSHNNQSLAWASNSKQLFALSHEGDIHRLDVFAGTTLSKWPIHSNKKPGCISLAGNDTFVATSANSSVSFWDTATHRQIGPIIHHAAHIECMAISTNYSLVVGGDDKITLWNLPDILPFSYFDNLVSTFENFVA